MSHVITRPSNRGVSIDQELPGIISLMNGLSPLSALRRNIRDTTGDFFRQRFFSDRLSVVLLVGAGAVNALNVLLLALHVRPTSAAVPTRFSSLNWFDSLGPWYYPFLIALFAILVTLANGLFAHYSFGRSRIASFFLLTGSAVVAIFSFIISMAFGAVK